MKGGKEVSGKISEPLFPRLHVNDREKGGPRAPPRNKMAVYEQLSIPSHKFKSAAASSEVYQQQRSTTFAPSDVPDQPAVHISENFHSQSSNNSTLNSTRVEFQRSSKRKANNVMSIDDEPARSSHRAPEASNANNSQLKNHDDFHDFMVPTFVPSNKNLSATETVRLDTPCAENSWKSSSLSPNSSDKQSKGTYTNNMRSRNIEQKHSEQSHTTASLINGSKRMSDSAIVAITSRYDTVVDAAIDVIDNGDNSRDGKESCSGASPTLITPNAPESPELGGDERNEVSESSSPSSISGVVISPDDVVGVIGPNHFWKARRAIVNQQRIFAMQVFELHRLIKVQKLISASTDVLKIDLHIRNPHAKLLAEDSPPENIKESQQPTVIQEPSQQNLNFLASDNRLNPWCFQPNPNQWLIPVMSPSEGLIYKPYLGPCPSNAGYIAPFCASPAYPSYPMLSVDYMNPYHQQPQMFFPTPYGQSITKPVEQVSMQNNVLNQASEVVLIQFQKSQASESSDAFPLFPVSLNSDDQENQNRVIRVVPLKARLATESAARIFRSIQEERKQYDS